MRYIIVVSQTLFFLPPFPNLYPNNYKAGKTIVEKAIEYAQREDLHTEDAEYTDFTIEQVFQSGAKWMQSELTRWLNAKEEPPETQVDVSIKMYFKNRWLNYTGCYDGDGNWFIRELTEDYNHNDFEIRWLPIPGLSDNPVK